MAMTQLVVSTRNEEKLAELRALLGGLKLEIVTAASCGVPEVDETGKTLAENAELKASAAFKVTGLPSLADDTGLYVDALFGQPGVHSARFAGANATYEVNRQLLIERMAHVQGNERLAEFVCCLALVLPAALFVEEIRNMKRVERGDGSYGWLRWVEGRVRGRILNEPRGAGTFGYDPLFFHPPSGRTFAELTKEQKNVVSHRGRAYRALFEHLDLRLR